MEIRNELLLDHLFFKLIELLEFYKLDPDILDLLIIVLDHGKFKLLPKLLPHLAMVVLHQLILKNQLLLVAADHIQVGYLREDLENEIR